jgi:hypothetical protein
MPSLPHRGSSVVAVYWNWEFREMGRRRGSAEIQRRHHECLNWTRQAAAASGMGHGMQSAVNMKMSDQGSGSRRYIGAEKRAACA